jgi:hypothetical protein
MMQFSPEHVAKALSPERMGGICFINSCAEGETLLTKDIDLYYKALVQEGHYLEIVTNLTVTSAIERILQWEPALLKHVEFKSSFHYLELKSRSLLPVFAENVRKIRAAGASVNIEITPSDELIPFIEEVKTFSMEHFGALPHLTIARDDRTKEIRKLTKLSEAEYASVWSQFHSEFWAFKQTIFGKKQTGFCYSGLWSVTVDIATGATKACYFRPMPSIFQNIDKPYPFAPIGKCPIAHCYNGHAFLTFGLIPNLTELGYGDVRNRVCADGSEWLQKELKDFFNTKLIDSNREWSLVEKKRYLWRRKHPGGLRGELGKYRFYQKLHNWKVRNR